MPAASADFGRGTPDRMSTMEHYVLLIEDDAGVARTIEESLARATNGPFIVERVSQLSEGLERLNEQRLTAVLLDLFLPDSQGISTFTQLFAFAPHLPILVLCGLDDEDIAQEAVNRGAHDYLPKNRLDTHSLTRALHCLITRQAAEDALFLERERAHVTLNSIGDAVINIDVLGNITYFNQVAEFMTGWSAKEALGRPFAEIVQIINGNTPEAVRNPKRWAIKQDQAVGPGLQSILIRRDGSETAIRESTAPLHSRGGLAAGAVTVLHGVSDAQPMAVKMTHLAQHDILTDLPNRLLLNDRITQAVSLARRQGKPVAVLFLDLNGFKQVNDSLGHEIGDKLLRQVAKRVIACVRTSDTVSRIGGDEFVILLPEVADAVDAAFAAEKVLAALAKPYVISERDLNLTGCIGISIYPEDGHNADTLLKSADAAMYQAKGQGPSSYQFFEQKNNVRDVERQFLARGLGRALDRQEFLLHYQPKFDIAKGTITGAEALIRWMDPVRGLILPARFLPLAEDSGLMVPIGQWVLREACRQARGWIDAGLRPIPVAVNISAVELRDKQFLDAVCGILKDTRLEPQYLEFELTESVLMNDDASTISVLLALKTMGVRLALDDFGSGYANLAYLRRLPIDILKIDQSSMLEINVDEGAAAFLRAVIIMGRILKKRVVAEGVETRAQVEFLVAERCAEGQGNYFSPPVVAEHFAQLRDTEQVSS
jgi:diguanylate cyclase (GGDEF)-like protein/PAS domain S-box-containing protein